MSLHHSLWNVSDEFSSKVGLGTGKRDLMQDFHLKQLYLGSCRLTNTGNIAKNVIFHLRQQLIEYLRKNVVILEMNYVLIGV